MNVKTYQGSTMGEALAKVKAELGADAVILHTRSFKRGGMMGLGSKMVVEITAGVDVKVQARRKVAAAKARNDESGEFTTGATATATMDRNPLKRAYGAATISNKTTSSEVDSNPTAARLARLEKMGINDQAAEVRRTAANANTLANTMNADTRQMATSALKEPAFELRNELASLRSMVENLLQRTANSGGKRVDLPAQLSALYTQLIQQQVSDEIAARVVNDVKAELAPEQLSNASLVRERLVQKLEGLLPANIVPAVARPTTGAGCRSICLIGPTGVGKTTTIAKLAASFKLRQRQKVGLITIDTYRIAAVDQLRTYANIIGVPLRVVLTPNELVTAMQEMSDCDTILIDTAGRAHSDELKLNELKQFIDAANPTEVHLVLSSTTTQEAMEAAVEKFGNLRVDQMIFTKLDEAVSFGVLLNVARSASRALSYVTTGQDVPDCIEVGQPRRLAKLILGDKL